MKYLKELCNVYWARPENALWLTKVMHEMDKMHDMEKMHDIEKMQAMRGKKVGKAYKR